MCLRNVFSPDDVMGIVLTGAVVERPETTRSWVSPPRAAMSRSRTRGSEWTASKSMVSASVVTAIIA
jgi:hypothetical protein